jgi:hypothetical protein
MKRTLKTQATGTKLIAKEDLIISADLSVVDPKKKVLRLRSIAENMMRKTMHNMLERGNSQMGTG